MAVKSTGTTLFIYGTLKRGQTNHHLLAEQCYLGEVATARRFRLLSLGWYPGLAEARTDRVGLSIEGEAWEVTRKCLEILDHYEGSEYRRCRIELMPSDVVHVSMPIQAYLLREPDWSLPDVGARWNPSPTGS